MYNEVNWIMDKIILFGAGNRGKDAIISLSNRYEIEYIVDNDKDKINRMGDLEGVKINGIENLETMKEKDVRIVITPVDNKEIIAQLLEMQIDNIFTYEANRDIKSVLYSVKKKKQLEAHEISIGKFLNLVSGKYSIELDNVCFRSGGSGVLDYAFLRAIMQYFNLKTYLEVGTYIGESISNVASIADKCFSITVPLDHPASMSSFCKQYGMVDFSNRLVCQSNIKQYFADSKEFDFRMIDEKIDVYFIDGDHSMEGIENDTRKVWKHKGKDSFVVWHDVKKEGYQINEIAIEAIYNVLGNEEMQKFYICDNCKCGIYVPDECCSFFDSLCDFNRDVLYSYKLSIEVREY